MGIYIIVYYCKGDEANLSQNQNKEQKQMNQIIPNQQSLNIISNTKSSQL